MEITIYEFMSLDGVVQAPGGSEEDTDGGFAHGGWSMPYFDEAVMGPFIGALMDDTAGLLYGRRTYEGMAAAWPDRAGDPFADWMNGLPKWVASRTKTQDELTWNGTTLLDPQDTIGAITALKAQDGGTLQVWGSASLTTQLWEHDLVDELRVMVEPVLLGGGKGIFPTDGTKRPLVLVDLQQASTGTLCCTYRPA